MNSQANSTNSALDYLKWFVAIALIVAAIGGNYYFSSEALLLRVIGVIVLLGSAVLVGLTTVRGQAINKLRKEAWAEVRKVIWPTRQETVQTTLIVIAFVLVVALILWGIDTLLSYIVSLVLG